MAIVQPGNQAFHSIMSKGWELESRQEGVMKAVAVIGVSGDRLTVKEISGPVTGNHLTGLRAGNEQVIKIEELGRFAERKLIVLSGSDGSKGSWTIVDEKLVPKKFSGEEVTWSYTRVV